MEVWFWFRSPFFSSTDQLRWMHPRMGEGFAQNHLPRGWRWWYKSNQPYSPDSSYWCSYSEYEVHEGCNLLRMWVVPCLLRLPSSLPRSRQNLYIKGCHFSCGPWLWSSSDENNIECPTVQPNLFLQYWHTHTHMDVSKNRGTPKSSIWIGFSIINHPFWGTPIFGNIHIYI